MAKPAIAYSYIRFSSPEQAKGDSIRRQEAARDAWLSKTGCQLSESVSLQDKGVSAFTGAHRTIPDRHALARFLDLCKEGRIVPGSFLIVENLDRLSREDIRPALSLFLQILDHKVNVVQLTPETVFRHDKTDPFDLMRAIMELSRGHGESALKSERCGAAWAKKKERAAKDGEPITPRGPAWLKVQGKRFIVIEPAAETIRTIYRWAADGYGLTAIRNRLDKENVPPFGRTGRWVRSYIAKLLSDRRVLGELQLYRGRGENRKPDGKLIPDYYPPIISEDAWFAAKEGLTGRKQKQGREASGPANIFKGLLWDARTGGPIHRVHFGYKRRYAPYLNKQPGKPVRGRTFLADVLEQAVLSKLQELDPRDVLPRNDRVADKVLSLSGRLADLDGRIEQIKGKLMEAPEIDELADVLGRLSKDRKAIADQLASAQQAAASPLATAWGEGQAMLGLALESDDTRIRLRSALRRIIKEVWCLFVANRKDRLAAVQVYFAGGACRSYLIHHRPTGGIGAKRRAGGTWVRSFADMPGAGDFDLRKKKDAAALVKVLEGLEL